MNVREFSIRRLAGACAANATKAAVAGLLLAGTAAAQSWDVSQMFTGSTNSAVIPTSSPWRAGKLTGPNCTTGFAVLNFQHTSMSPVRGLRAASPADLPAVGSTSTSFTSLGPNQITVPTNGVWLHPAQGPQGRNGDGDCAAVRFTAPSGLQKTYSYSGSFYGAYTQHNNAVVIAGIGNTVNGNGVVPKILRNGVLITTPTLTPTVTSNEQIFTNSVLLNAGDTLDFAVNNNGDYTSDSTILKLIVAGPTTMYPHGITAVTPGPVNTCAPYRLCFDVNVPNGPVGNGSANLSLQIVNNSVTPPTVIATPPPKTTAVDGLICFDMPALPAGTSYDYVVTTNFTQPVPGGNPLTAQTVLQSPIQGPNNDLVCQGGSPASTCCPPVNHDIVAGMFNDNHSNTSTSYNEFLVPNAPATVNFVNGLASYLAYLKFVCPQIVGLRAEFFTGQVAAPLSPGSPGPTGNAGPLSGAQLAASPANTYTSNVWGVGVVSALNNQLNPGFNNAPRVPGLYYRTSVKITGVNASGVAVNCGFDAIECAKGDSYGFVHSSTAGMKVGPGGATQSKFRTP